MTEKKRDWIRMLSPAALAMILVIFGIVASVLQIQSSGGWSILGLFLGFPIVIGLVLLHFVSRLIFREKTILIWIAESIVVILIFYFGLSRF